jgi:hypothetical protein
MMRVPGQGMEGRSKARLFLRSLPSVAERWPWLVITMNGFDGSEWIVTTRSLIVNCVGVSKRREREQN